MAGLLAFNWAELESLFFDFDGVIVDSVNLKSLAYREIFMPFGRDVVEYVTQYHRDHGGIDRHRKIDHVLDHFNLDPARGAGLADQFARIVKDQVIAAPVLQPAMSWLEEAARRTCPCFVVSGTPQDELLDIVEKKGLMGLFKAVRGSPDQKEVILADLLREHRLSPDRTIFVGDACTDFHAAQAHGILFVGVTSDVPGVTK